MAVLLSIVLGLLIVGSLIASAILQFRRRQALLERRHAERERPGEARAPRSDQGESS
ncbi:MAG: hypothetical protein QM679_01875 [Patulibacter sp.]